MRSRLQWNRFRYINDPFEDLVFGFDVHVKTKVLTINEISDYRKFRLDLILNLHNNGLSNKDISSNLNDNGIKSPCGLDYTQKLIWVTLKKIKERELRKDDTRVIVGPHYFFVKSIKMSLLESEEIDLKI